jgi:hypothetical protein
MRNEASSPKGWLRKLAAASKYQAGWRVGCGLTVCYSGSGGCKDAKGLLEKGSCR